jgi:hypothetical protein
VVFDTLSTWMKVAAGGENDSATMAHVYASQQPLLDQNLAIVNCLHSRKAESGTPGDSARGSNISAGSCDVILDMQRLPGKQANKNLRLLDGSGTRFDETPEQLVIEWADGVYVARGASSAVAKAEVTEWLRQHLPDTEAEAQTIEQLQQVAGEMSYSTLYRILHGPGVEKIGVGKRGNPNRYFKSPVWKIKVAGKGFVI